VMTGAGESRCRSGEALPATAELPGLAPSVEDLFRQLLQG